MKPWAWIVSAVASCGFVLAALAVTNVVTSEPHEMNSRGTTGGAAAASAGGGIDKASDRGREPASRSGGRSTPRSTDAPSPTPSVSPSPGASASVSPSPTASASPSPLPPPTAAEIRQLRSEFARAQKAELDALKHRQSIDLTELKASQKARRKEWEHQEEAKRHEFFAKNPGGPARRQYMQDYRDRYRAMETILTDEMNRMKGDSSARYNSVKDDEAQKNKEFEEFLGKGLRPPRGLWPGGGM